MLSLYLVLELKVLGFHCYTKSIKPLQNVLAYLYALHHIIPNVSMSATQTDLDCFYSNTTIITMVSKYFTSISVPTLSSQRKHNTQ
jgi:hypothetical protein